MDHEWSTYFQCGLDAATHQIKLTEGEYPGCLRPCPPGWELRGEFHHRVEVVEVERVGVIWGTPEDVRCEMDQRVETAAKAAGLTIQ